MLSEQPPPAAADSGSDPTESGHRAFTQWLDAQLIASNLTQRQLAQKSGVDHSTISRLRRGARTPSLRTATLLAQSLGMAGGLDWLHDSSLGRPAGLLSAMARVERALRLDALLDEDQVRGIMNAYLSIRRRRLRLLATPDSALAPMTAPPPVVGESPDVRARSTSMQRSPSAERDGSG